MSDEEFHDMMETQNFGFYETFSDQIFLFNDLYQPRLIEKCNVAILDPRLIEGQVEEGFQRTSRLSEQNEVSNFENLDEVFSDSEFEDEEILAISDVGLKISKALANRVSNFLSDDNQVKRFVMEIENEEYEESDSEYWDTESTLDSDDEYMLAMESYEPIVDEIARIEGQDKDAFLEKCCLLVAMMQPDEVDTSIIRDMLKMSNRAIKPNREENTSQFSFTMEDRRKPETSRVLLEDLSMRINDETTKSDVENHVAKTLDATCDPSRIASSQNSFKMANDQRMKELVGHRDLHSTLPKAQSDVQEVQLNETLNAKPSQRSALNSACVGSSSGDLMDSKVYDLDESCFRYSFEDMLEEEQGIDGIWSILTDRLYYLQLTNSEPIQFQEANLTKTAKKNLFDAANNNIPKKNYYKTLENEREQLNFNVEGRLCKLDDQYDNINVVLDRNFNPNRNITTTYLWSHMSEYLSQPKIVRTESTWFPQGNFDISIDGVTQGNLLDGTPIRVRTLIDSGCTKPVLSKAFYDKTKFLHQYPKFKIQPRRIKCANGEFIVIDECLVMMIVFQGHVFEMVVYILELCDDYDFIIGQKTMYELEGGPNFGTLSFHFLMRSIPLKAMEEFTLKPGETRNYGLEMLLVPPGFQGGTAVVKLRSENPGALPQTLKLDLDKRGKGIIRAHNEGLKPWTIHIGETMGSVDMRSLGYFHIDRDNIVTTFSDKCNFLSEEETCEYICKVIEDHNELCEYVNTKLVDRNEQFCKDTNLSTKDDPYPWLDIDDPRRKMTDQEIIEHYVNLKDSDLTPKETKALIKVIMKYKKAFSLRDEIGTCPHIEVELELKDTKPFFIRPFPVKEGEKDIIDKEMRKGCLLGILKKGMTSYSSPIMLIPRKQGGIPRIVTDFRHLNTRLVTLHPSIPLVRDAIQILGASGCEVISVIDLRDAYHTLRLSKNSQKYCGITPYYGSDTYLYQRLGMGLSVSPAVWQNFIQKVLSEIPNHRKHHLAIMDDCLVHSKKNDHLGHLIDLFRALIRNGLKISPKKCQLFRKKLVYMGHTLLIEDGIPQITPLKTRVDAILKLDPPKTPKNCKQFCGMVNFLSVFLKDLQLKLAPIYQLTRKGIPWDWTDECQKAFEDIKKSLTTPPVLVMPNEKGHFVLVSDTSTIGCGGTLYQEIEGDYRVVAYYSKKLPDAVKRYSISELELTGILANISAFKHILRNVDFTVYCDHSALVHIIQAKREPPTLRLQKLVEHLMNYKFSIKFLKGKEMFVTDFLSRHPDNDSDSPNEIIPIAFLLKDVAKQWDKANPKDLKKSKIFLSHECVKCEDHIYVLTRSMAKEQAADIPAMYPLKGDHNLPEVSQSGIIKVPETKKEVNPIQTKIEEIKPEKEMEYVRNFQITNKPSLTNVQPNLPIAKPMAQPFSVSKRETMEHLKIKNRNPFYRSRIVDPIPTDVRVVGKLPAYDIEIDEDKDRWMISEEDKNRIDRQLITSFDPEIVSKFLPKQIDLDRFIENLKDKVIHDYKIPIGIKELRAEYYSSPWFQDIYKYLKKGICRYTGNAKFSFKQSCEDYFLINDVLF